MFGPRAEDLEDTIVAIATPPGRGAIGLVRLSGPRSRDVLERIFRPMRKTGWPEPRALTLGRLVDPEDGSVLDQALGAFLPGPATYTGQDMAELSFHGAPVLAAAALSAALAAGARLAQPGEFTLRAFLGGKMDLVQAEAVRDLVDARTRHQARLAAAQLRGGLSREVKPVKEALLDLVTRLETALEFGEDQGIETGVNSVEACTAILEPLGRLAGGFARARLVREGFVLVVTGRPNVGKSSLFNALVGRERAIVTELPGTTRDALREEATIAGWPVTLVDTAGIRETEDRLERLGIERSREAVSESHVTLHVVDGSMPWPEEDRVLLTGLPDAGLVIVLNKCDLPAAVSPEEVEAVRPGVPRVVLSARTEEGLEELRDAIARLLDPAGSVMPESSLVGNLRQQEAIRSATAAVSQALEAGCSGLSEEYILYHLRAALDCLDDLTGATTTDDLLGRIFSTFCVGK